MYILAQIHAHTHEIVVYFSYDIDHIIITKMSKLSFSRAFLLFSDSGFVVVRSREYEIFECEQLTNGIYSKIYTHTIPINMYLRNVCILCIESGCRLIALSYVFVFTSNLFLYAFFPGKTPMIALYVCGFLLFA